MIEFLKVRNKYWYIPVLIAPFLFGGRIVLSQGTAISSFI
jgi:hypothetical protein